MTVAHGFERGGGMDRVDERLWRWVWGGGIVGIGGDRRGERVHEMKDRTDVDREK